MAPVDTQGTGRVVRTASQEGLTKSPRCLKPQQGNVTLVAQGGSSIPRGA